MLVPINALLLGAPLMSSQFDSINLHYFSHSNRVTPFLKLSVVCFKTPPSYLIQIFLPSLSSGSACEYRSLEWVRWSGLLPSPSTSCFRAFAEKESCLLKQESEPRFGSLSDGCHLGHSEMVGSPSPIAFEPCLWDTAVHMLLHCGPLCSKLIIW